MTLRLPRLALLVILCATSLLLNGCLISNFSSSSSAGITTLQATATVLQPSPCTVNAAAQTTTCTPVMEIGLPTGGTQNFPFLIELLGYAAPLTLYDPLIVQVPATMSNFAGSITAGPPGVNPGTPLSVIAGLTSVPIDATTNLVAEPRMHNSSSWFPRTHRGSQRHVYLPPAILGHDQFDQGRVCGETRRGRQHRITCPSSHASPISPTFRRFHCR